MISSIKTLKYSFLDADWVGKVLLPLVMLFPILSLSVRHWLSLIFQLIVVLSLVVIWSREKRLYREEKILFILFLISLCIFFLSAILNGWTDSSFRRVGTELRYVLFFPLYLLIRQYPRALEWLIVGIALGAIVLGVQAIHDTFFTGYGKGKGIYGPIIFGDLAVLFAIMSAIALRFMPQRNRGDYILYGAAIFMGLLAGYLSGSRNAWLAAIILLLILPFITMDRIRIKKLLIGYFLVAAIAGMMIFLGPQKLVQRGKIAFEQFTQYTQENLAEGELSRSSIGFRLEQWRVSLLIIREKPILGFGPGNVGREFNRYVEAGKAHPDLYNEYAYRGHTGTHSAYFDKLVAGGTIGGIVFLFFLFYPGYVFLKYRKENQYISGLGIVFISGFAIFSLTEDPFIHNNFTAVYLVLLAILYSVFIRYKYKNS